MNIRNGLKEFPHFRTQLSTVGLCIGDPGGFIVLHIFLDICVTDHHFRIIVHRGKIEIQLVIYGIQLLYGGICLHGHKIIIVNKRHHNEKQDDNTACQGAHGKKKFSFQ